MQKQSYFDEAAEVLERALKATAIPEQGRLLEEALRLNKLALAEQRRDRSSLGAGPANQSTRLP